MNILVLDVAASESGALSVLQQYYNGISHNDKNHYYLCISNPLLEDKENITVLRFPWAKKTWLNRLWFEFFYVNKLAAKYNADVVYSLENLIIRTTKCEEWIFLQNCLPFAQTRFSLHKDTKMWVYKHLIGYLIKRSLKRADKVFVQANWMKEICASNGIDQNKIFVKKPSVDKAKIVICQDRLMAAKTFFYPAVAFTYKNHMLILEALRMLNENGFLNNIAVEFSVDSNENDYTQSLFAYSQQHNLPVRFLGKLSFDQVMQKYAQTTLIFPSYIETVGLPLLEARLSESKIFVSNCAFAREILAGYEHVCFFDPFNFMDLAENLRKHIEAINGEVSAWRC